MLGEDVAFGRESPGRGKTAYLPQDPVFPERHTGQEVMELVASLYGIAPTGAKDKIADLLSQFHLEKAKRHSVGTYSRGMKQRLGLAACFLPEPDLLVLDEPVSALDPEGRVEVFNLIREAKGSATVLFSSHILEDIERVSDSLVMIKEGEDVVDGPMEEILARYAPDRIKIRIRTGDSDKARALLENMPWFDSVTGETNDGSAGRNGRHQSGSGDAPAEYQDSCTIYGNVRMGQMEAALDNTLAALVQEGIRIREFGRSRADLEAVFLRLNAVKRSHD